MLSISVLVAACGGDDGDESNGASGSTGTQAASTSTGDPSEFAALFEGYDGSYDPVDSPAELAEASDFVVSGQISEVRTGPEEILQDDPRLTSKYIVLDIAVDSVLVGTAPAAFDNHVYLMLPAPGGVEASVFDAAAPKDQKVLLYAVLFEEKDEDLPVENFDAGRPDGQPLVIPTNPQGFIIGADGGVLTILEHDQLAGSDLTEFLPDSERFPYDPSAPEE
jgi:hypothetical protein